MCGIEFEKPYSTSIKTWIEKSRFCSRKCLYEWRRNNPEYKGKLNLEGLKLGWAMNGEQNVGRSPYNKGQSPSLETRDKIRKTLESKKLGYRRLRRMVFKRDDFSCVWCGYISSRKIINNRSDIIIDHIKPLCVYPELKMDISNLRTLCEPCHRKTETYGRVSKYQSI